MVLCLHTRVWDPDHEKFPLSCELDEQTPKLLLASDDLELEKGDPKLNRLSVSELFERRGAIIVSCSNDGLAVPTNDISLSIDSSP